MQVETDDDEIQPIDFAGERDGFELLQRLSALGWSVAVESDGRVGIKVTAQPEGGGGPVIDVAGRSLADVAPGLVKACLGYRPFAA